MGCWLPPRPGTVPGCLLHGTGVEICSDQSGVQFLGKLTGLVEDLECGVAAGGLTSRRSLPPCDAELSSFCMGRLVQATIHLIQSTIGLQTSSVLQKPGRTIIRCSP